MKRFQTRKVIGILLLIFIASVCSGQNSYRDRLLQPDKIMDLIGVRPGMMIGEGGAGQGYFTFKLAARVGETGRIYANDISKRALDVLEDRCREREVNNITTVMGEVEDPLFPTTQLDMVFMVAAFHDFAEPVEWLVNVKRYIKPDATLVIVEKDPKKLSRGSSHHMTVDEILEAAEKAGYELVGLEDFLEQDNVFVFRPFPKK